MVFNSKWVFFRLFFIPLDSISIETWKLIFCLCFVYHTNSKNSINLSTVGDVRLWIPMWDQIQSKYEKMAQCNVWFIDFYVYAINHITHRRISTNKKCGSSKNNHFGPYFTNNRNKTKDSELVCSLFEYISSQTNLIKTKHN